MKSSSIARDKANAMLSGVCAGIANHYDWPRWSTRLVALLVLMSMPVAAILGYVIAALMMPNQFSY